MKKILGIIFLLSISLVTFEYLALNEVIGQKSILYSLGLINTLEYNTRPGGPFGMAIGIIGFSLMVSLLFYSILKRKTQIKKATLRKSLDFHIFLGLLGPILIIFHSNFQLSGFVVIPFLSMLIAFGSGFIGKVIYSKVLKHEKNEKRLIYYQRLLGNWHSFHLPFSILMYLLSSVHIIASLLFGVSYD